MLGNELVMATTGPWPGSAQPGTLTAGRLLSTVAPPGLALGPLTDLVTHSSQDQGSVSATWPCWVVTACGNMAHVAHASRHTQVH